MRDSSVSKTIAQVLQDSGFVNRSWQRPALGDQILNQKNRTMDAESTLYLATIQIQNSYVFVLIMCALVQSCIRRQRISFY